MPSIKILKRMRTEEKLTEQTARGMAPEADWGAPWEVTHEMTRMGPWQFLFSSPGSWTMLMAMGYTVSTKTMLLCDRNESSRSRFQGI